MDLDPAATAAPLDPRWIACIDDVAPRALGRADRTGSPLAAAVARLSELYTRERAAIEDAAQAHAARLRFFLPRDLPKVQAPLAELLRVNALSAPGDSVRVLDVGAGLGTTSLGAAELLHRAGAARLEVTALERDRGALDVFTSLARRAQQAGLVPEIRLKTRDVDLERPEATARVGEYDLILVGLAMNELFRGQDAAARADAVAGWVSRLSESLAPGGSLVLLEPALRSVTRELMALRDRIAAGDAELGVFAPCVHAGRCPLLERERDWCHGELPFALPAPLPEIARAAGLREQRLTFAYLTLRRDGRSLREAFGAAPRAPRRVVGGPLRTKGKTEWELCGEDGRVRLRVIDRERANHDEALDGAARGALLDIDAEPKGGSLRARPDVSVRRV